MAVTTTKSISFLAVDNVPASSPFLEAIRYLYKLPVNIVVLEKNRKGVQEGISPVVTIFIWLGTIALLLGLAFLEFRKRGLI